MTVENLIELLKKIIEHKDTESELIKRIELWYVPYIEQTGIIDLLVKTAQTEEQYKRILPLHRKVKRTFLKKNKDDISEVLFEINFFRIPET